MLVVDGYLKVVVVGIIMGSWTDKWDTISQTFSVPTVRTWTEEVPSMVQEQSEIIIFQSISFLLRTTQAFIS